MRRIAVAVCSLFAAAPDSSGDIAAQRFYADAPPLQFSSPRGKVRISVIAIFAAAGLAAATLLIAGTPGSPGDTTADRVLGQPDFTQSAPFTSSLNIPLGVAIDASATPNRLYVADGNNNRVLGWRDAASFADGAVADLVIGQPDFLSTFCDGASGTAVSANSLCFPAGVAADGAGNLWVADANNYRVLEYTNPFAACAGMFPCVGDAANLVFGQGGSFTSNVVNNGGVSADSLGFGPEGVALDGAGHLWVADSGNHRVLEYDQPLTNTTANEVFGQGGSFISNVLNNGGVSADSLDTPVGVVVDGAGHLWVADIFNSRVLEYNTPLTNTTANEVFGQRGSFKTRDCNRSGVSADSLCVPVGVAVDAAGHLWVADSNNNRVLEYDQPLTNTTANEVFGQGGSFTSQVVNNGAVSADSLSGPGGVALDGAGNLYVADTENYRVLEYDQPPTTPTSVPVTLKINPKALKFPKTMVGTPSKPKMVKVSNPKGSKKHPGYSVLIEMISDPEVFTETNNCPMSLAAGTGCSISVTFTPSAATNQTGTLTITDNAKGGTQTVQLSGTGK